MFETALISLVETYGQMGLLLVMIIQTLIAPIPSEAVLAFSGVVMDFYDVVVFGGIGLIAGSVMAFYIARYGGRPIVVRLVGEKWINGIDGWVSRNGMKSILFTRIVPIIPFDLISYVSGVTSMNFRSYFIATVAGAIPRVILLAYLGSVAGEMLKVIGAGIEIIFVLGISGFVFLFYMERKGYLGGIEDTVVGKLLKRFGHEN